MALSRGAQRCLDRLRFYARQTGRAFPFQDTLAVDLKRDVRTVQRYISELVDFGAVKVIRRQHHSAEYVVSEEIVACNCGKADKNVGSEPSDVRSDVRSGDFILSEVKTLSLRKPARKPMGVEIPPEYITTASGRQVINPAWQRVRDKIRAAHQDGRLHSARDRYAYIAAIIRAESERAS
jgi:hypothetical protein